MCRPAHVPALAVLHDSHDVWHRRLGYCGIQVLGSLRKAKVIHYSVLRTIVLHVVLLSHKGYL